MCVSGIIKYSPWQTSIFLVEFFQGSVQMRKTIFPTYILVYYNVNAVLFLLIKQFFFIFSSLNFENGYCSKVFFFYLFYRGTILLFLWRCAPIVSVSFFYYLLFNKCKHTYHSKTHFFGQYLLTTYIYVPKSCFCTLLQSFI